MQTKPLVNDMSTAVAVVAIKAKRLVPEQRAASYRNVDAMTGASDGEGSRRQTRPIPQHPITTAPHFGLSIRIDGSSTRAATDEEIIAIARLALDAKIMRQGHIASPSDAKAFVSLRLGNLPHEVFAIVFVDAQHRVIEFLELFRGTLTQTSVYPREVVKEALRLNAAAVIFTHNHPSGVAEPSRADELLTQTLKSALLLVDVRVLDHLVVAGGQVVSFVERGLL